MCKKHTLAERYLVGDDGTGTKCKICRHLVYKQNYESNKQKILDRCKNYRQSNRDKIKTLRKKYTMNIKLNKFVDIKNTRSYLMLTRLLIDIEKTLRDYS